MMTPASTADEIVAHLQSLRSEENIAGMARFGIVTDTALGISNAVLRPIARQIKRNQTRAEQLWRTNIREARLLALYTAEPSKLTEQQARIWAEDFQSWEIVDQAADTFVSANLYQTLIPEFAADSREFARRTAFAMMASGAVHLKKQPDSLILGWLPLIEQHSTDPRNFVRKAVNWALRNIGKRSQTCFASAMALAEKLANTTDKTARWIGKDAVRDLKAKAASREKTGR